MEGNWRDALRVRTRMQRACVKLTVHVYNALIAACERANQCDRAMELFRQMTSEGVVPNNVTQQLMSGVGKKGVAAVEGQQAAAAALTAALAAAGSLLGAF